MSSYMKFYGVPRDRSKESGDGKVENKDAKPVNIITFSRNDDVYRYFDENCNIPYCYDKTTYRDITSDDIDRVVCDIRGDISSTEKRIAEYSKYADKNEQYVLEIISSRDYLEELQKTLHYVEFIGLIVAEAEDKYCGDFTKIVANI